MFKRAPLILVVLLAIVFLFSGCGSQEKSVKRPTPVSIDGSYKTSSADGPNFDVKIEDNTITINLHLDESTSGLYWKGTAPNLAVGEFSSTADAKALDASLVGSLAGSKTFKADGKSVSFEFQIMGTTTQVEAVR